MGDGAPAVETPTETPTVPSTPDKTDWAKTLVISCQNGGKVNIRKG